MNLSDLSAEAWRDSCDWFPAIHRRGLVGTVAHLGLGLAGEAGELANLVKKVDRLGRISADTQRDMALELADVFTYILLLAAALDVDLTWAYDQKRQQNMDRF